MNLYGGNQSRVHTRFFSVHPMQIAKGKFTTNQKRKIELTNLANRHSYDEIKQLQALVAHSYPYAPHSSVKMTSLLHLGQRILI